MCYNKKSTNEVEDGRVSKGTFQLQAVKTMTQVAEVVFKVYAEVLHGEDIRISGNTPGLGKNDVSRAVRMVTSPQLYPWWESESEILLPVDADVSYRYCKFSGGEFQDWEGDFVREFDGNKDPVDEYGMKVISRTVDFPPRLKSFRSHQIDEWNALLNNEVHLDSSDRVIIISYFLPIIAKKVDGCWTVRWDEESLLSLSLPIDTLWVGLLAGVEEFSSNDEEELSDVLRQFNCHPIFVAPSIHRQFYEAFCMKTMWPIMHDVSDVFAPEADFEISSQEQRDIWYSNSTVCRLFRNKLIEVFSKGDLIWIHGFHFMLLPSYLRRVFPDAKIGYFIHVPFPTSEIWRRLPRREDLLRALLSADQIGFHLYDYAAHFLTCCLRLFGHRSQMNAKGNLVVDVNGREVIVSCMHCGTSLMHVERVLDSPSFESRTRCWKSLANNKIVIAGIDRLERLRAIPLKLHAIKRFMEMHPEWLGKLVFVIIGISAEELGGDYELTKRDVTIMVKELNRLYGDDLGPLIHFEERHESQARLEHRLSFLAIADVLISTAARDGFSRIPIEYALARERASKLFGTVNSCRMILSEFISVSRVMRGAITVNPWNISQVAEAIENALIMSCSEDLDRTAKSVEFSHRLTSERWSVQLLEILKSVVKRETRLSLKLGFGTKYHILGKSKLPDALDMCSVVASYRQARHRLIVLDWGGTIVTEPETCDPLQAYSVASGNTSRTGPTSTLKALLKNLCEDPRNVIFIISGKDKRCVEEFFGGIPRLGLAAEHGVFFVWPRSEATTESMSRKWSSAQSVGNTGWKEAVLHLLKQFQQRTAGTYIEHKESALIWQFYDADMEFGLTQSKELEQALRLLPGMETIDVIRGGGVSDRYIEIRPKGICKGCFVQDSCKRMETTSRPVDFLLVAGDEVTDESMFEIANSYCPPEEALNRSEARTSSFSITVGRKPSSARSFVETPTELLEMLNQLHLSSRRVSKYHSVTDLTGFSWAPSENETPTTLSQLGSPVRPPVNTSFLSLTSGKRSLSSPDESLSLRSSSSDGSLMSHFVRSIRPIENLPPARSGILDRYVPDDNDGLFF